VFTANQSTGLSPLRSGSRLFPGALNLGSAASRGAADFIPCWAASVPHSKDCAPALRATQTLAPTEIADTSLYAFVNRPSHQPTAQLEMSRRP
jgi:hypothetical protein